jgi:hypothetical protein
MRYGLLAIAACITFAVSADNTARPFADPVLDIPTLHCLGCYWVIQGDDNRNARIEVSYRKCCEKSWQRGPDLFRVEKNDGTYKSQRSERKATVSVPPDAWLFAGSIFLLDENTTYEIKLMLCDPDGGKAERKLSCATIAEPVASANAPAYHVIPGSGGGDGSASHPFVGLAAAQKAAKPGDIFLLHAGVYGGGTFTIEKSGEPGRPIVWRGPPNGEGEAVIDGGRSQEKLEGAVVELGGQHDVWFERLALRNAHNGIHGHDSSRVVVRRCHITHVICGVFAAGENKDGTMGRYFVCDNLMEGIMPWPATDEQWHALPESRAVWLGGRGNVICYNRIHHFKDAVDTAECPRMDSCDIHNNEISECFDDGTELDGSERNTRCYFNRYTNVFQGISFQPVYGGPSYAFRNVIYNCQVEPFKLHNCPSGCLMIHNTIVRNGGPALFSTSDSPTNCYSRNNLYIGTEGRALHYDPEMIRCDWDYDGFGVKLADVFLKWNGVKYETLAEVRSNCPVERHCILLDPKTVFQSGVQPPDDNKKVFEIKLNDLRLKDGCGAMDAGEVLPGFNSGFSGKAPDLGAYEFGTQAPYYGIRAEK